LESRFAWPTKFLTLIVGVGLVGCGGVDDDLPRQAVSGTITLGGEPLAQGRIQFEPVSPDAKVTAGGEISDGKFAIPRDQGPTPGDYRVMISSAGARKEGIDTSPGAEPPPTNKRGAVKLAPPAPELIPKEYNAKTTLTAKVEAGKTNTFEFTLKK
jgi:hypothetical protein